MFNKLQNKSNAITLQFFRKLLILFVSIFFCSYLQAEKLCFNEAGKYYNIDPVLLRSIAKVESNFKKNAIGINKDAKGNIISRDYGIMQINQFHVPSLIKNNVIKDVNDLIDNPCLNIQIGAWILYTHFKKCGVTWQCVGTYNTGFTGGNDLKKRQYIVKVYNIYADYYYVENQKREHLLQ